MKKLLLTLISSFAICISADAQTAKTKKFNLLTNEVDAKTEAEKKAKYNELQKRKNQIDLEATKTKQTGSGNIIPTQDNQTKK